MATNLQARLAKLEQGKRKPAYVMIWADTTPRQREERIKAKAREAGVPESAVKVLGIGWMDEVNIAARNAAATET